AQGKVPHVERHRGLRLRMNSVGRGEWLPGPRADWPSTAAGAFALSSDCADQGDAEMTTSQAELAKRFQALHQSGTFIIANAFDAGSARVLAGLGFPAVATSSGAFAGTLGRRDGKVIREEALAHARAVANAVDVPVSADLENGFGHAPEFAAETVRHAAGVGLVGCTIEDATGEKDRPLYDVEQATA